ncbi:MAG: protein kinase, partial [Deltaproteobacteria bacterium]|nr:protein kinase [Deltaproteobacteria bacterium]
MPTPFEKYDRYTLLHRIAIGGMCDIFLAHAPDNPKESQLVVIKRLREQVAQDPEYIKMFLDEEQLLGRLSHPNIVRSLDFGKAGGRYFIALEHVWGESLTTLAILCQKQRTPFPLNAALAVCARVGRALDHAHNLRDPSGNLTPVIHRDVTMGNVLVTYRGEVKILD